jgi:DNA-binding MarR family transcriptional regulator
MIGRMAIAEQKTAANPLKTLLGYQIRRAWAAMSSDLAQAVEDLDLTLTEMSILLLVEANPNITQSEICRELSLHRANVAPLAATLSQRDLIEREAVDRRSHGLTLSPLGKSLAREARRRIGEHEKKFLARIPAGEREALLHRINALWDVKD